MEIQETPYTSEKLENLVHLCLDEATKHGASDVEASLNIEHGLSVTARLGDVETIEHHNDRALNVTVYFDKKKGASSTTNIETSSVKDVITAACNIAKYTQEDNCAGLADADRMASTIQDLELDHPWGITPEEALDLTIECENKAREFEKISNSEGSTLSTSRGTSFYANSNGFSGNYRSTRHNLSCVVIAEQNGTMQRDYWYSISRNPVHLESVVSVGERAARRTLNRLGARKISTRTMPVIFEANMARSLISHFVSAISGGALYRKASFLLDQINKKVFSDMVCISEDPHIKEGLASSAYDLEGVATEPRILVEDGVLKGYVLSSYSARRLGMQTTGNAGGIHNLILQTGEKDLEGLIKDMSTGLLVTELIGHGVNNVTGDYSRGAVGYWVENGEIQYPVEEITIAGNLKSMFKNIVAIGNDVDPRGAIITPSILVDGMMIAGS